MRQEETSSGCPVIGAQRPAVVEDDWLALAPILVKDLGAILGRDRYSWFNS